MTEPANQADWEVIERTLPDGWRALGSEMGLVRKRAPHIGQKIHDVGIALRLVLHYVAKRGSMRMTTTAAAIAGIVSISQPAFFKWMFKIGAYLEALVARMIEPGQYTAAKWGRYALVVADATTVERPGAKGTTARIHYALRLSDLSPRCIRITDEKVGETMRNFDPEPGELWIVDRGYSNPGSVVETVRRGADLLVRLNRHALPLYDALGKRVDVLGRLAATRKRGRAQQKDVRIILADGSQVHAQLCWLRLPKPQAAKARARAAGDGVTDNAELDAAECLVVVTTAPTSRLSSQQALELYRARWQVELDFKRDKSIGQLDALPTLLPQTIHAWLCAKVLLGLIAKKLASQSVAIPPSGLGDAILAISQASSPPSGSRRRALVRDADGVGHGASRDATHRAA